MASVETLYKELTVEWSKRPANLVKCGQLLDQLKVALVKLAFLPTDGADAQNSKKQLLLARSVLEIAVEHSVLKKELQAFERYMSQLKCYYYDYAKIIGESDCKYKLLGLNLLYLLSENRVSDFHTELELLSVDIIQNNQFIRPILALEQYIMEGRYNKIFQANSSMPAEIYNYFMDLLVETVRDEIGACIEMSYEKISAKEAAKRLNLRLPEEMKAFGEKRHWKLESNGNYSFTDRSIKPKELLPSEELAEQVLSYARDLEMIV
ncbi:uncharacterized protein Dwil_GK20064 [Drosophila willistoni]|uniref:26S proteasome non-ATPase regulatory subunit 8 n=1 Tax=Drosophila willistoni TaxID=7260 RepID=B4MXF6_DROWI|nr:26S proteasome non-ATPase regulatory subunit 8 [Drosophila willistoni]EDW76725.1 uncharacterized protein Dwil_GK20064 [Drosophila willistoni]